MMTIKKWFTTIFTTIIPLIAFSQNSDFGIWYGVTAEHKLIHKLEMNVAADVRTYDNAKKIEEFFAEGGLSYNISKHLSAAASYRLIKFRENDESFYFRHKFFGDLKGSLPLGNFGFSCRLRFQSRTKTYIADDNDDIAHYTGRVKLKTIFKTPKFPVNPYMYYEAFCPMFTDKSRTIGKNRFSAGAEVKIARHNSADIEYIFQRDYLPHLSDMKIISLNYNIKF